MDTKLVYSGKWVVDRFVDGNVVLENIVTLEAIALPKTGLPKGAKPGDTLFMQDEKWLFDHDETKARKRRIQERFSRIKEKASQDDLKS